MKYITLILICLTLLGCETYEKKSADSNSITNLFTVPPSVEGLSHSILKDTASLTRHVRVILSDEQFDYAFKFKDGGLELDCRYGTAKVMDYTVLWFILGAMAIIALFITAYEYCMKVITESKEQRIRMQLELARIDFQKTELLMKNQE